MQAIQIVFAHFWLFAYLWWAYKIALLDTSWVANIKSDEMELGGGDREMKYPLPDRLTNWSDGAYADPIKVSFNCN